MTSISQMPQTTEVDNRILLDFYKSTAKKQALTIFGPIVSLRFDNLRRLLEKERIQIPQFS